MGARKRREPHAPLPRAGRRTDRIGRAGRVMREIPLSRGRFAAVVDDEDYEGLAVYRWHLHSNGHPNRWAWVNGVKRRVAMQRELLGNPPGIIDHANGNRLDNR